LSKAFVDSHFALYDKVLNGTPELPPRWKRVVAATNDALGEAVGKLYVARYFSPQDKAAIQILVRNLIAAFGRRIDSLTWMSPQTKIKARDKLKTLKVGVGYPDHWRSYDGLKVVRGDAFGNAQRAELFKTQQALARLSRPVDRDEWVMNPQLVDAVKMRSIWRPMIGRRSGRRHASTNHAVGSCSFGQAANSLCSSTSFTQMFSRTSSERTVSRKPITFRNRSASFSIQNSRAPPFGF
jgi:hypothetical protein